MEAFFKYGIRVYLALLVGGAVLFMYSTVNDLPFVILSLVMLYMAGNIKLAHGTLFNEGGLKRYNQFLWGAFNIVCAYWLFIGF